LQNYSYNLTHIGDVNALAQYLLRSGQVTTAAYKDSLTEDTGLQIYLVRTILTIKQKEANSYLARGWRIIAMNYEGGVDEAGLLVGCRAMFVLGHPEPDAI
jgi:hypothetical protein